MFLMCCRFDVFLRLLCFVGVAVFECVPGFQKFLMFCRVSMFLMFVMLPILCGFY